MEGFGVPCDFLICRINWRRLLANRQQRYRHFIGRVETEDETFEGAIHTNWVRKDQPLQPIGKTTDGLRRNTNGD